MHDIENKSFDEIAAGDEAELTRTRRRQEIACSAEEAVIARGCRELTA